MTPPTETRLRECEASLADALERGRVAFQEIGAALKTIRDERLYRESHDTFEDYCRDRWGFSRQHAHRMITGSDISALLSPVGDTDPPPPTSERQVRPLGALPVEERAEAWREATEAAGSTPTAADVERAVERRKHRPAPAPEPEPEPEPSPEEEDEFDAIAEIERLGKENDALRDMVKQLQSGDVEARYVELASRYGQLEGRLNEAIRTQSEATKDAKYAKGMLARIRKALGVEQDRDILAAIEARRAA